MKTFTDCKEEIHSCSKCGLCQSVCPVYKVTGNDCTVSRGHFIMLRGLLNGELKMSKIINRYLDLCLKCSACTKFCPSGIDVVDIVALAKSEYFKLHKIEKIKSFFLRKFVFDFGVRFCGLIHKNVKSKAFDKKVVYFGGCSGRMQGNSHIVKLLNSCGIEVVSPDFECCGIPFFVRGDMKSFQQYMESFFAKLKETGVTDVVTSCASCEKALKSYSEKWGKDIKPFDYTVKNIYEYMRENGLKPRLNRKLKVTYHKPCNLNNYDDIKWLLNNTYNLEYTEMQNYDSCCGFNGISKIKEYKINSKIFTLKRENIIATGAKYVLTSCLGCESALNIFSLGKYKVEDLAKFIAVHQDK